ncbi:MULTISPECIES: N-acetylmuramoyl-L-alanine amidase [Gordonia]|uniref:Putative N-acetylmuramoyl-L-alanine amidase n=1 Tax=Gordonia sihwensis NBRC 108236 TaxID=1223544 RepID=L7LKT0_9ACTN|nr:MULTISPECIES: N-acetylmuramoyl-L-alanine amidase [Gordonia]AUH67511.1 N-acetylmuramoyl-L-alanine amidase [Gordonia sp. YC-JH1]KXT56981.1 N-acetylmuramoyl-L-alanine amidase [Gordonia sp. QH-12]WFN92822.1 N-acetylmuramoyl-L-alanine amidase [Gordonia sihwensis]GAC61356.1 putative N-acetylmuramoyl-L-alanine amidase [Gordonia sihwensis NBRC 108236]
MQVLRLGDHGSAVAEIRAILATRGLLPDAAPTPPSTTQGPWSPPEAVFDKACDRAVRAFQQERGLIVDGIVGYATYTALREASYRLGARILLYRLSAPMTGDDVATLQSRLQNLGYYHGLVDGIFSEVTHHAVCLYQTEYGLSSDGICGPATLRSLERLGTRVTGGSPHAIREEEHVRKSGPQLTGKRILIDPGDESPIGNENTLLWDLAARLEGRMSAAGMETFLSHDAKTTPTDDDRVRVANLADVDLMISLRTGHYPNEKASGLATFYFGNTHGSYSTIGRNLAGYIQREIVARTGFLDCRSHPRTWNILRSTRMPVIVIEAGYITNPHDAAQLSDPAIRDTIAEAVLVAVKRLYLLGENDRPTGTYTFAELLAAEQVTG